MIENKKPNKYDWIRRTRIKNENEMWHGLNAMQNLKSAQQITKHWTLHTHTHYVPCVVEYPARALHYTWAKVT